MGWLAVAVLLTAAASSDGEVRRIRLCADPSNLPFSSRSDGEPGFEVEIARAVAAALRADFSVHWVPMVREVVAFRQLYEDRCDVLMGMPLTERFTDDKPGVAFTASYYVMRQAIASPSLGAVRTLAELQGKLVGVQAMTLSDSLVYERGVNRKIYVTSEETFSALTRGEDDAEVVEPLIAGWYDV